MKHKRSLKGSIMTNKNAKEKESRTIKDYPIKNYRGYGPMVVPAGSTVTNQTACGPNDNYRFWVDFHKVAEKVSGFKNSLLKHDLTYYGLNIPAEYCEPYKGNL